MGRKIKTPSKLKTRGILVKEVDDKRQAFVQTCTIVSAHCNAPLHRIAMPRRGALLCVGCGALLCALTVHCYAPLLRIAVRPYCALLCALTAHCYAPLLRIAMRPYGAWPIFGKHSFFGIV